MSAESEFRRARAEVLRARTALMTDTRAEIVRYLKEALSRIETVLAGQPTDYQRWSLARLAAEIRQVLVAFGEAAGATISGAAGRAWQLGEELVDRPLAAGGIAIEAALGAIDTRQLLAMRAFMTERVRNIGLAAADQINAELGLVVIGAQSPGDAITKTRRILGERSRSRATTIVRTELGRAFSAASHERLGASAALVPGLKKQWRKSGKAHPRLHHDLADGQVREVSEPFSFANGARLMHPHDPAAPASETINCGCVMLPWKEDWAMRYRGRAPGGLDAGPSLRELLREAYDPAQPRDEHGRWTSTGAKLVVFAARAQGAHNVHEKHDLGPVDARSIERATGIKVEGFRHQLDNFGVRHAFTHHGNPRIERPRGQRAVRADDFARVAEVIRAPDRIVAVGQSRLGRQLIRFDKRFGAETFRYLAEVRTGRRELATMTFYITVQK